MIPFKTRVLMLCATFMAASYGDVVFYSGDLRTNATITGCGASCTLGAADSNATWAQWAAVGISFNLLNPANVTATTLGFGGGTSATGPVVPAGGFEPYLSLFNSSGTFLVSTYLGTTCPPGAGSVGGNCYDVKLDAGLLAAGSYTLVVSAYLNMTSAENSGSGKLADGMTGLGNLATGENLNYALDLNRGNQLAATPEPGVGLLVLAGAALVGVRFAKTKRRG